VGPISTRPSSPPVLATTATSGDSLSVADSLRTLLTVKDVAAYLRVSKATVYELCARGRVPLRVEFEMAAASG